MAQGTLHGQSLAIPGCSELPRLPTPFLLGQVFSSHGWTQYVKPPVMEHGCPHMVAPPSLGASPATAALFCIWVSGQLRMFSVQSTRWVPQGETRVTQSTPSPGSRVVGFWDEQRDPHGLPRGTDSKNEPVGQAASFPPAGLLIGPGARPRSPLPPCWGRVPRSEVGAMGAL